MNHELRDRSGAVYSGYSSRRIFLEATPHPQIPSTDCFGLVLNIEESLAVFLVYQLHTTELFEGYSQLALKFPKFWEISTSTLMILQPQYRLQTWCPP